MDRASDVENAAPRRDEDVPMTERTDDRPSFDEIAAEAYAIYLADGATDGHDLDHWLEAERRLRARAQPATDLQQDARDRQHDEGSERLLDRRDAAIM